MPGKLKPLDVHREQKPGKRADGDGLYLIVAGATSKNWSYRYWFKGKERWHGLGSFKDVSLKDARLARDAARLQVRAGVDLVREKRAAREEKKAVEAMEEAKTFEECAQAYIDEHWNGWSKKHRGQWPSSLKRYEFKEAMRQRIREIAASRDLSDEEIKPVLRLKHQEIGEFTEKNGVNLEWLLEGKGRIFKKDPIRLSPNMTGGEFAAMVATMPMADQQAISAMVYEILQERNQ